ncbi:class I SAM-dependent methyltransferase [Texcoconibacillus texcoconensis]|uniref:2-polyprenyl-3-methyl-5-hydroxy-6-metoxy-1, 4-benzoquinol methylase n=1 Tax=Texcoconibacillus texcoconensis TaxID=1095777 RepID=A0A840QLS2_9BACI|nr:class I SAM-dependent methyltransferase [Texcoconibacillus texcoconensis]MBB5172317.1 2-polyprenyl-3-methyl-5-hydroxy-6-metoxy-1,4-benzoquinol methylase [Texcoconibacillus texcoconensis]
MSMWDERFRKQEYQYGTEPNVFIEQKASELQGESVLAVAEGEGRNAVFLAKQGFDVTAWDASIEGLKKTETLAEKNGVNVKTEQVDLGNVMWPQEQYDHVVMVFGHFDEDVQASVLKGIKQAIKPGGSFLCEVYSKTQRNYGTGGPKREELLYDPQLFLTTFADWHIPYFFIGDVERYEGHLHQGKSHVIQILTRK